MKKIIVTGATGCVGSAVVRCALSQGFDVACIVHQGSQRLSNLPQDRHVSLIECSLADYGSLQIGGKYDAFIHLAWEKTFGALRDDAEVQTRNIQYTLEACRLANRCGCSVFVGAGSQAEYGVQTKALSSNLFVNPESGYGIAKYAAGKLSRMLCKSLGLRHNWVRILSVYGPNDGANTLISYVIRELQDGHSPQLTKCEQTWDYLYAEDAANAILSIAGKGLDGKIYALGSGNGRKLSSYIEDIRDLVNPSVELGFGEKAYYAHQPMYLVADIAELTADTGWNPVYSFQDGIRKMMGEL